eukprot:gnl/TRDRNA2_/TRDRNA2_171810_c0_seq12.p1 gnl/TRDRNA2_/TRDRNA2_171810_c0~~gnl/TRDRNA2_/TRDRNA2_171810_c0_seq12.p1  ORF type:complete len:338 (+),score=47.86 gnl/TRDRNA2_/TRDRNA2_171810_c0_seq12:282-1295(+)
MPDEFGLILQCAMCGSFRFMVVAWLTEAEVQIHAGIGNTKRRDLQAAAEKLVERRAQERYAAESGQHFSFRTCPTCIEIATDIPYETWLDKEISSSEDIPVCPMLAVVFEEGELPPMYRDKGGTWTLMQGVGPKTLEVKPRGRMPASQFKILLPSKVDLIRPRCWENRRGSRDSGKDEVSQEVWAQRSALITTASQAWDHLSSHEANISERVEELCSVAEAKYIDAVGFKGRNNKGNDIGAKYIKVPLLTMPDDVRSAIDAWEISGCSALDKDVIRLDSLGAHAQSSRWDPSGSHARFLGILVFTTCTLMSWSNLQKICSSVHQQQVQTVQRPFIST